MFGIKTALKKAVPRIALRLSYWPACLANTLKKSPEGNRVIFVTLGDKRPNGDIPRHLYSIFYYLIESGYRISVYQKMDFSFYDWLKKYGRHMFALEHLKFVTRIPNDTQNMIYLFDHEDLSSDLLERKWKKLVYLSVLKPASWCVGETILRIPFMMYPGIYRMGLNRRLDCFRSRERKMRIFFAGNATKYYYRNPILKKYDQLTRRQGIAALLKARACQIVYKPSKRAFDSGIRGSAYRHECVVMDFSKFKIKTKRWLDVVSTADFFICFSGTDYPMSHHLIEALAVGTIPIMSYPELMDPPLEQGKNALLYKTEAELAERFDEAMNMNRGQIDQMKSNVIRYYEDHLAPENFASRLESCAGPHTFALHAWLIERDASDASRRKLDRLNEHILKVGMQVGV